MRFELIFVRHGESCANAWQHVSKLTQATYRDPELTTKGRQLSVALYPALKDLLLKRAKALGVDTKKLNYTVGASDLMRSQMTAFYMLAVHEHMPINIMPFVGERGYSPDNLAFTKEKQLQVYKDESLPDIAELISLGKDARDKQGWVNKSNFPSFIEWARQNLEFFGQGPDGVYRAIIFTHSQFLQSAFQPENAEGDTLTKITNNDIVYTVVDDAKKPNASKDAFNVLYPKWRYVDMSQYKPNIGNTCPKNFSCRIPRPCKQNAGRRRKTYRRSRTRRRYSFFKVV